MNVLHSFFVDFSDQDVYVNVGETRSSVHCDYETLQVALYVSFTKTVLFKSIIILNLNSIMRRNKFPRNRLQKS